MSARRVADGTVFQRCVRCDPAWGGSLEKDHEGVEERWETVGDRAIGVQRMKRLIPRCRQPSLEYVGATLAKHYRDRSQVRALDELPNPLVRARI